MVLSFTHTHTHMHTSLSTHIKKEKPCIYTYAKFTLGPVGDEERDREEDQTEDRGQRTRV